MKEYKLKSPNIIGQLILTTSELIELTCRNHMIFRRMTRNKSKKYYIAGYGLLSRERERGEKKYILDRETKSEMGDDEWDFFVSEYSLDKRNFPIIKSNTYYTISEIVDSTFCYKHCFLDSIFVSAATGEWSARINHELGIIYITLKEIEEDYHIKEEPNNLIPLDHEPTEDDYTYRPGMNQ